MVPAVATACVIPPPLDREQVDADINSPPVITAASDATAQSLRPPATLTINRPSPASPINLTLYDTDPEDELEIRFYVNYDPSDPKPHRITCPASPSSGGAPERTATCLNTGLCTSEEDLSETHRLEIEVYDRPAPINFPYRVLDTTSGTLFSTWTLDLLCTDIPL